jgi:DNA modification methylase
MDTRGGLNKIGAIEKKNKRSVWTVTTKPFTEAHFATFPKELILPCVLAGCPEGGTVLDPFAGSGTTGIVANHKNRNAILLELSEDYIKIAVKRIKKEVGTLFLNLNIIRKKDESIKFI